MTKQLSVFEVTQAARPPSRGAGRGTERRLVGSHKIENFREFLGGKEFLNLNF